MSVEKVREMVCRDEVMEELTHDEVTLEEKIKEGLKMIGNNSNIDVFFDTGMSVASTVRPKPARSCRSSRSCKYP